VKEYAAPGFHRKVGPQIPEELQPALQPLLDTLEAVAGRMLHFDQELRRLRTKVYPETALRYVLTIEDPRRIERSRNVGAYLGLRPRQRQSGQRDPELRITKAGDRELRSLLVQCAQYILGPFGVDSDLRRGLMQRFGQPGVPSGKSIDDDGQVHSI
jgi:transposase